MMILKLRLKEMRERSDLRKSQLAEFLHITVRTYSRYEECVVAPPLLVMARLASFYGTSIDFLIGLTDVYKPYERKK